MDIVNRLKLFMESKGIAISQFADTCGIPRPTMSQILNGRNKKISDELITKIHFSYPELSVLWLMFGEGSMESNANIQTSEVENGKKNVMFTSQNIDDQQINPEKNSQQPPIDSGLNNSTKSFFGHYNADDFISADVNASGISEFRYAGNKETPSSTDSFIDFGTINTLGKPQPQPSGEPSKSTKQPSVSKPSSSDTDLKDSYSSSVLQFNKEGNNNPDPHSGTKSVNLQTAPGKKITNIVVFYSDNSFQSFYPAYI